MAIFFVIACSAGKPLLKPVNEDVVRMQEKGQTVSLDSLKLGYKLYVNNCSGCHSLHLPTEKSKEHWENLLPEMFTRTKLTDSQKDMVKLFIYSKL